MNATLTVKDKIESQKFIKAARFKKNIRTTVPHKHNNYFEIIYLSDGSGSHTIDYNRYEIKPSTLFFMRKEQVHHWELTSEPEGYVVILKNGFIEKSLDGELKKLFSKLSNYTSLYVQNTETIELLFQLLVLECANEEEDNFTLIEGLLKALLAKLLGMIAKIEQEPDIANTTIYQRFNELLSQSQIIKNQVAYYAEILNTTPQNLNAVCRKTVNLTATQILSGHIINEAKRQLIYTDNRIAEIAYKLDFSDASHFVKYFKRHTGVTPQVFRMQ
ncbi:helix-turn-helix domain-containing protein [Arcicella sp. DC2W]|uniref:Helix-turn-helix domain-containing protein n=1 Tax=Arcicella gelida TaxID=2984195 RepID=A0ABU5S1Z2_9BACT|nr:helix-turn-helix domain-containing protein [Arcicella sp. DC2W]MEA5402471.1 helix-turn-helix domain-containing protein [Arcicella sp. DC2W]